MIVVEFYACRNSKKGGCKGLDRQLESLSDEIENKIKRCTTIDELKQISVEYLGRKDGKVTNLLRSLKTLPVTERPIVGKQINELKQKISKLLSEKETEIADKIKKEKLILEDIDVTMSPFVPAYGKKHPITQVLDEIVDIFMRLGFEIEEGPEVEYSYLNFDALNIPPDHPARDMHDTFYITEDILLRTHTSPVQIRVMKQRQPPLRIIAPGRVYRRDADVSHSPMFHQVEGLLVGEDTSFSELKGVLEAFIHAMFGKDTPVRFRPSFFPFTEPSCEIDIGCVICEGNGCGICKQTGWLEILGAGMVDPEVFKEVNYDTEKYIGFAFGLGIERIAMLKYRIDNIRLFFENDLRFLKQF
jgi:phenylalanyl-tRNA synthetase alpha chain